MLIRKNNPHGGDIYSNKVKLDFSANINPLGMPDGVKAAVALSVEKCCAYPDPYCSELRRKIAAAENTDPVNIICGCGAAELIYQFSYSLDKSRPALIVSPTFCEYEQALAAAGITAEHYILDEKNGFVLTDDILDTDFSAYSAVFICSPNNPTGITVEPEIIRSIASSGIRTLCDFCFLDLTKEPENYDIPQLISDYPNIVVLKAFTKSYAMAGLRLGYAICSDDAFIEKMSSRTQCWNISTPAQLAGVAALDCVSWLKDSVSYIASQREFLTKGLADTGIKVYPGEANYLLLRSRPDLAEKLMRKGIMIRDCSDYIGLENGFFRVAIRTRAENVRLIEALKEILK